ncbi:hypothetical protein GQ44DRAFT_822333 [Phaeosphaeriaceae sp. PMI808]|nr:hypothetical protein GQ44DRAFT_822333 [Phaeosphaeriaceae sp. PMI808]
MFSKRALSLLFLTWLLLLSSPANAAPAKPPVKSVVPIPSHVVAPTPTPKGPPELLKSKAELKKDYFKAAPKKDKSCFFTGMDIPDPKDAAKKTAESKKQCKAAKLTTLEQIWNKNNILNQGEWKKPISKDAWSNFLVWVFEVFAEETTGVAFLLLTGGVKPRKESIFYANEFKAMKSSGKVDKIMNVKFVSVTNPTLPDPSKDENVWWKKGAADPPAREDKCPDKTVPECT